MTKSNQDTSGITDTQRLEWLDDHAKQKNSAHWGGGCDENTRWVDPSVEWSIVHRVRDGTYNFPAKLSKLTLREAIDAAMSASGITEVGAERVAILTAHRACHSAEHDPANGRIHGYCIVCGVPWPCEYSGLPEAKADNVSAVLQKELTYALRDVIACAQTVLDNTHWDVRYGSGDLNDSMNRGLGVLAKADSVSNGGSSTAVGVSPPTSVPAPVAQNTLATCPKEEKELGEKECVESNPRTSDRSSLP